MRVLALGNQEKTKLGRKFCRAFKNKNVKIKCLGHSLILDNACWWLKNKYLSRLTVRSLVARRYGSKRANEMVKEAVTSYEPDIIFIIQGELLMPETISDISSTENCVMMFNADDPFHLPDTFPPYSSPYPSGRPEHVAAARESDCYFIWSRSLARRLKGEGVPRVEYLPFGWDADVYPYTSPSSSPEHEVVFIGGWDARREEWLTPVAQEFDLKIWGPSNWGERTKPDSPLRKCWQGEAVRGEHAAEIISNSKVCLNILRQQNLPDGTNMRTFEVPGAGGFLLSTWSEGAAEIFPEGEAASYFRNLEDLLYKVEYYLQNDKKRRAIAKRGHKRVQEHTYDDRVDKICSIYEEIGS